MRSGVLQSSGNHFTLCAFIEMLIKNAFLVTTCYLFNMMGALL